MSDWERNSEALKCLHSNSNTLFFEKIFTGRRFRAKKKMNSKPKLKKPYKVKLHPCFNGTIFSDQFWKWLSQKLFSEKLTFAFVKESVSFLIFIILKK